MICRLYGREGSIHFKLEWTPLAHHIAKTCIQSGAYPIIQSPKRCEREKRDTEEKNLGFYMSTFFYWFSLFLKIISYDVLRLEP